MDANLDSCHREITTTIHQTHFACFVKLVKCFKWQSWNVVQWFIIILVSESSSRFNVVIIFIVVIVGVCVIFINLLLKRFDRGWVSDTFFADFDKILFGLILAFHRSLFTLMYGQLSSQKLSPILIELFNSIKCKHNAIFLFNSVILSPQRDNFNINLELFEYSWFYLFSDFELIPDFSTDSLFVVYF